jgi:methanogenic corrinoid protein MtbC1
MSERAPEGDPARWGSYARHREPEARSSRRHGSVGALERTVQAQVIPRLVLAHSFRAQSVVLASGGDCLPPAEEDVAAFAQFALDHGVPQIVDRVRAMCRGGLPLAACYLHLVAPAARHLHDLWQCERADFVGVSVAVGRMQQAVRRLEGELVPGAGGVYSGRRALVVAVPGEQHGLGVQLVAEFFRQAGWDVSSEPPQGAAQLVQRVRVTRFDVVGLSVSRDAALPAVAPLIDALRHASRNRHLRILVGGAAFRSHPEYAANLKADATGQDALQAVDHANALVALEAA